MNNNECTIVMNEILNSYECITQQSAFTTTVGGGQDRQKIIKKKKTWNKTKIICVLCHNHKQLLNRELISHCF